MNAVITGLLDSLIEIWLPVGVYWFSEIVGNAALRAILRALNSD
jgi:hypothetical protein